MAQNNLRNVFFILPLLVLMVVGCSKKEKQTVSPQPKNKTIAEVRDCLDKLPQAINLIKADEEGLVEGTMGTSASSEKLWVFTAEAVSPEKAKEVEKRLPDIAKDPFYGAVTSPMESGTVAKYVWGAAGSDAHPAMKSARDCVKP